VSIALPAPNYRKLAWWKRRDDEIVTRLTRRFGREQKLSAASKFSAAIDALVARNGFDETRAKQLKRNTARLRMLCHELGAAANADNDAAEAVLLILETDGHGDDVPFLRFAGACPEAKAKVLDEGPETEA
jgi:hypothetical protein